MNFTKKQLKELKEAESYFQTMVYADYKRNTPRALDEKVHQIYIEATGSPFNINYSCSACIGKLYKLVGKLYFEDLEKKVTVGTELSGSEGPEKGDSSKKVADNENKPKT